MFEVNDDSFAHIERLRADCHALFDACLAILAVRRTPEELERLPQRLAVNRRRCIIHRMDSRARRLSPDDHLHTLFKSAGSIFRAAVHHGERPFINRASSAGKAFSDRQGRWPARVEQLFPGGMHAALDGLFAHCELYISDAPIGVIADVLDIARPVVFPVLASEPFRTRLLDVVVNTLDPAASGIVQRAPALQEPRRALEKGVYLLEALLVGPGAIQHEGAQIFAGHEAALLRAIASVTETMDDDDYLLVPLSEWCVKLVAHPGCAMPPRMRRWLDAQTHRNCCHGAAHGLHRLVFAHVTSRVCAGPGCALSVLQNDGGKAFAACARCRIPRYCSRACQRAHWKGDGATLPHKALCGVLAKLDAHAHSKVGLDEFIEVYTRVEPNFDDTELDGIHALMESAPGQADAEADSSGESRASSPSLLQE
ncbi:hypothetical protein AURDEDRAFT_171470 [Auricularia subglabra TFB-10046 SS5]|nr:hypothetical protein AURDEDRAFT_171470 [Auricularia subglabra TFB-10046 SS5]